MATFNKQSMFNRSNCIIRKMYCGSKKTVPSGYSRKGTSYECLKKGFGISDWQHRKKSLSKNSLQQITYIGPVYEENFKKLGITTIPKLVSTLKTLSKQEKAKILKKACSKKYPDSKTRVVDQKAVNSVIIFLHDRGMTGLPNCVIVYE